MDSELMKLALLSSPEDMIEAAKYVGQHPPPASSFPHCGYHYVPSLSLVPGTMSRIHTCKTRLSCSIIRYVCGYVC